MPHQKTEKNTSSTHPHITKISRSLPHRAHHHHKHHRSSSIIHINTQSTSNQSSNHQKSLHTISTVNKNSHLHDTSKERHIHITTIHSDRAKKNHHASLQGISKSDSSIKKLQPKDSWVTKSNDSEQTIVSESSEHRSRSSKVAHYESNDAWLDRMGNTQDHHRTRNETKKKKYKRYRIIALVLIASIVMIAVITMLIILLIKFNTKTVTVAPTTTPILRWNSIGLTIAGGRGAGNNSDQLNTPWDAKLDYQNSLYIADTQNHRIQKYTRDASIGTTVAGIGANGSASNQLSVPSQVLVDSSYNLRIADTGNHKIELWLNGASTRSTIAGAGGRGNANNQLNTPYGIVYDTISDTLYVADYINARVMCYLSGASSGSVVAGGNGIGRNTTQLYYPLGLYLDSLSNSLIIVNNIGHNIVRWPLGGSNWTLVAGDFYGNSGSNVTMLKYPTDITLDPMGNMYVADRNNQRIQLFMNGQTEGITIVGVTGIVGNNSTLFNQPWSIELDNQLNLYVADSNNHRIQKFLRY